MKNKTVAVLCAVFFAFCLTSCKESNFGYAGRSVVGKIAETNGSSVTLILGELTTIEPEVQPTESHKKADAEKSAGNTSQITLGSKFTEGGQVIDVNLSDAVIFKSSQTTKATELKKGDIIQVSFNEKGVAASVTVIEISPESVRTSYGGLLF